MFCTRLTSWFDLYIIHKRSSPRSRLLRGKLGGIWNPGTQIVWMNAGSVCEHCISRTIWIDKAELEFDHWRNIRQSDIPHLCKSRFCRMCWSFSIIPWCSSPTDALQCLLLYEMGSSLRKRECSLYYGTTSRLFLAEYSWQTSCFDGYFSGKHLVDSDYWHRCWLITRFLTCLTNWYYSSTSHAASWPVICNDALQYPRPKSHTHEKFR